MSERPLYETESDLQKEREIGKVIQDKFNVSLVKLPIRYHLDFVARRDKKAVGFIEIKSRSYTMDSIGKMGGYLMSIGKWGAAKTLSESSGLPFILVVNAVDQLWYSRYTTFVPDDVWVMGREDRGDWQDIEPCVVLNTARFKRL